MRPKQILILLCMCSLCPASDSSTSGSASKSPAPGSGGIDIVHLDDQPWSTASDNAIARQIASPNNSRARQISIADIRVPPGVAIKRHYHNVIEEIYYITAGTGIVTVDGQERTVGVGDAVVIRPGQRHAIRNDSKSELRLIVTCSPPWTPDCVILD
jgi:mannose-6-phosphate isomerase-like protein (cupin superfamily)